MIKNGGVQQNHFGDDASIRIPESAQVDVYIKQSAEAPGPECCAVARRRRRSGYAATLLLCTAFAACGGSSVTPASPTPGTAATNTGSTTTTTPPAAGTAADGTIYLQHLPIDLSTLDYDAMVAGRTGREDDWLPLEDFGRVNASSSARLESGANPQPTFFAPLGTPVVAVVSGTVSEVAPLYSNDFSVMIASGAKSGGIWEHEHVMNVRVGVGDTVVAGQHIGDVSDYECSWGRNGSPDDPLCQSHLGLVELGLLYGGASATHRCPFDPAVVSPDAQAGIFAQLDSARSRIEAAFGDASLYDQSAWATPECVTLDRVSG
jgi:hypothetical protein